jgi:hypothetical protein
MTMCRRPEFVPLVLVKKDDADNEGDGNDVGDDDDMDTSETRA